SGAKLDKVTTIALVCVGAGASGRMTVPFGRRRSRSSDRTLRTMSPNGADQRSVSLMLTDCPSLVRTICLRSSDGGTWTAAICTGGDSDEGDGPARGATLNM